MFPWAAGQPVRGGKEAYLPAFSWVAHLQYDQGPWGDGGGGGSEALPLLLDEMVSEEPRLQDKEQKVKEGEVVSDSLQPRGLWPTRLLHPWDSLGKNTGVGLPEPKNTAMNG